MALQNLASLLSRIPGGSTQNQGSDDNGLPAGKQLADGTVLTGRGVRIGRVFMTPDSEGHFVVEAADSPNVVAALGNLSPKWEAALTQLEQKGQKVSITQLPLRHLNGNTYRIATCRESRRTPGLRIMTVIIGGQVPLSAPKDQVTFDLGDGVTGSVATTATFGPKLSVAIDQITTTSVN